LIRKIVEEKRVIDSLASAPVSSTSQAIVADQFILNNGRTPWCLALQRFMDASMTFPSSNPAHLQRELDALDDARKKLGLKKCPQYISEALNSTTSVLTGNMLERKQP
jgi:hypothetical protein